MIVLVLRCSWVDTCNDCSLRSDQQVSLWRCHFALLVLLFNNRMATLIRISQTMLRPSLYMRVNWVRRPLSPHQSIRRTKPVSLLRLLMLLLPLHTWYMRTSQVHGCVCVCECERKLKGRDTLSMQVRMKSIDRGWRGDMWQVFGEKGDVKQGEWVRRGQGIGSGKTEWRGGGWRWT